MFDLIPFEEKNGGLFDYFDKLNRSFFDSFGGSFTPCRTDILDQGDKYVLKADMPGFKKEDIKIDVDGDRLTLTAEHNEENDDKDKDGNYIRRERRYGALSRSFDVSEIDADKISAAYHDGVLELNLPKKATAQPAARQIEVK